MANKNKAVGTSWESRIVAYFKEGGENGTHLHTYRKAQTGSQDQGDIEIRGKNYVMVLEAKAEKRFDLASYIEQADKECWHAGADWGAAVVKAPRKNVSKAYVVMSLETFRNMLEEIL